MCIRDRYETFCQENLSFMFKALNMTVFQSGLSTLYSTEAMHDSYYKELTMKISKTEDVLRLSFDLVYATQVSGKQQRADNFVDILQLGKRGTTEFLECFNCKDSKVFRATEDGKETLYEKSKESPLEHVSLSQIWEAKSYD